MVPEHICVQENTVLYENIRLLQNNFRTQIQFKKKDLKSEYAYFEYEHARDIVGIWMFSFNLDTVCVIVT